MFDFVPVNKMVFYCVVPGCRNSSNTPGILMHPFPDQFNMRVLWIGRIPHDTLRENANDVSLRVCSNHFKQEDYKWKSKRKVALKKDAIPSIFEIDFKIPFPQKPLQQTDCVDESSFSEIVKANRPSNPGDLPDLVLIKIFSYLNFEDRCLAALVCRRWYNISKSSAVWKKVTAKIKTPYHILRFMFLLPASVTELHIFCSLIDIHRPLYLPDILYRLHERCPHIKSLILENVFFTQRLCNTVLTTNSMCQSFSNTNRRVRKFDGHANCLPDLTLICLRYSHSFMSHLSSQLSEFFPNVQVVDLTYSTCLKDAVIPFFCKIPNLEELYLVECPITNSGLENLLKHLKRLKVLDLEGSRSVNDKTFEILQCHGRTLEKLYLGNTGVKNFHILDDDLPCNFSQLQMICLKNTGINPWFITNLMHIPSLKHIIVSPSDKIVHYRKDADFVWGKITLDTNEDDLCICHHFKIKYMYDN